MLKNTKRIYLVDTDNVHSAWLTLLSNVIPEYEKVYVFVPAVDSQKVTFEDMDLINKLGDSLEFVDCAYGSPNAMDFQLSSLLGALIAKYTTDYEYVIVSDDKGYNPLIEFWGHHKNIRMQRMGTNHAFLQTRYVRHSPKEDITQSPLSIAN